MSSKKKKPQYGLKRTSFAKRVQWAVDQDYIDGNINPVSGYKSRPLDEKERAWLDNFNDGYYGGNPKKLYPDDSNPEHLMKRKTVYGENNARMRDLYSFAECNGRIKSMEEPEVKRHSAISQDEAVNLKRSERQKSELNQLNIVKEQWSKYFSSESEEDVPVLVGTESEDDLT
jgi:hypothetical protein